MAIIAFAVSFCLVLAHSSATILITGFAPFDRQPSNPSGSIASALNNTCVSGVCFVSKVLPVTSSGASQIANMLAATNSSPWEAIIHLVCMCACHGEWTFVGRNNSNLLDSHKHTTTISTGGRRPRNVSKSNKATRRISCRKCAVTH